MKTPKEFLLDFSPSLKSEDIEKMNDFSGEFLLLMMGKYSEYLLEKKRICDIISVKKLK